MERLFRIFYILLTATCVLVSAKDTIFGANKEFTYSFSADIKTGTDDYTEYASKFGLKSALIIQSNEDGSSAIFHLSNISMEVYNGPLSADGVSDAKYIATSEKSLEEPFEVIYSDGLVKSIITNEKEETMWSKNMKKSIAAIFQLDLKKIHLDEYYAFITEEKTIYGICPTEYSVMANGKDNSVIRKMPSHSGCKNANIYNLWSNLEEVTCNNEGKHTIHRGSERSFEILADENHTIKSVNTQGYFSFSPYLGDGFSKYVRVQQTFELEGEHPAEKYESISGVKENDLTFTAMDLDENSDTYLSITGEKNMASKETLIEMIKEQLNHLIQLLEDINVGGPNDDGGFLEQKNNEKSRMLSFELTKTLKYLDYESLKNIFSTVGVGTSYMEETVRELFLELLSQTGTKASITFLKDIIIGKSVQVETAMEILKTIPFYVRHPDEALLKTYEEVLTIEENDRLKRAAILSFATMVYKTCKGDNCSPEVLDKYILKYLEHFNEATDYEWQLTYMEGLSNIQIGNVVKYLEPIVKGEQTDSRHLRFLAMWASHQTAIQDPERVFEVYWPILEYDDTPLELRIGAFTVLLLSKLQPQRFHSLAEIMAEEPEGSHLYYFYYTSLQSLSETTHPCYQEMKKTAQHILRYAKKPDRELPYTGNNMFDYIDTDYTFGSLIQTFAVSDEITAAPSIIYIKENEYFLGRNKQMMGLYLKVQGLSDFIKNKYSQTQDPDKLTKLQQLLLKYGVKDNERDSDALHIEVILQFQDKAVITYYFNQTTFIEWFKAHTTPPADPVKDFHINYQRLFFPIIQEMSAPTDLGVPMSLNVQTPVLFSFRVNFSINGIENKLIKKLQVDMKYWRKGDIILAVYNPIAKLWHGISRSHSTVVHFPLNVHVSTDIINKNLKFSLHRNENNVPGLALHAGSHLFTVPFMLSNGKNAEKFLHDSCPSCLSYIPVVGENHEEKMEYENEEIGRLRMNYVFRYFDCDVQNMPFILDNAFEETLINANDRFTGGEGLLYLIQYHNTMMHLPVDGRCGFVAKVIPEIGTDISNWIGVLNYIADDDDTSSKDKKISSGTPENKGFLIRGSFSRENQEGDAVQLYDFSLNKNSSGPLNHHLKFKFTANDPSYEKLKMCLDAAINFPEPPMDPLKQRDPEEEMVTGFIKTVVGLAPNNRCPKSGVILKMAGRALPVPDMSLESYANCADEAQSPEWAPRNSTFMPSTLACREAAFDSTKLRRVEFSMEASDFITKILSKSLYALYIDSGTDPWGKYKVNSNYSSDEYPVIKDGSGYVIEFVPNGLLLLDTIDDEERERVVFDIGDMPLMNSRFGLYDSMSHDENMDGSCVVTASTILTLNKNYLTYEAKPCYALALGHCYNANPTFAILTRTNEGTQNLALKIYSPTQDLEIIPESDNSIKVIVNGEPIDFDNELGYQVQDSFETIRVWQRHSKDQNNTLYLEIYSSLGDFQVDYTGDRVVIEKSPVFAAHLCGLCGNFFKQPAHTKWDVC